MISQLKKQERFEKLTEMSKNNDYTTGNLSELSFHHNHYKLIGTDLPRQTNTNILQQMNFVGKLKEGDGATIFFIIVTEQYI